MLEMFELSEFPQTFLTNPSKLRSYGLTMLFGLIHFQVCSVQYQITSMWPTFKSMHVHVKCCKYELHSIGRLYNIDD